MENNWRQIPSIGGGSVWIYLGAKSQDANGLIHEDT